MGKKTKMCLIGFSGNGKDFLLAPLLLKSYLYEKEINKDHKIDIKNYNLNYSNKKIINETRDYDIICLES
jgi:hypothetical protein